MAITNAQQFRQMFYRGGSPADDHNQPGGGSSNSGGAPDAATGGGNDYYDQRFQTVVSPPQSQAGRGPYDDNESSRLSNFVNRVGSGIGSGIDNVANFYGNPINQRGILGTILGSLFFGPFGGILGGMYGRGQFKNPFTVEEPISIDSDLIDNRFMGSQGIGITPKILPKNKPIFRSKYPEIKLYDEHMGTG
tara:strand:+ start:762 stop:1337 length:576 start_codon:yes stop_codon:yes gene_type:complete